MKFSKSSKRYIEFKHINDQEPLRIPMTRSFIDSAIRKIGIRRPVFIDHDCDCHYAPNTGSTSDYPWTPTEYAKNTDCH